MLNEANRINVNRWMSESYDDIKVLALHELSLPSAHNAGMDCKARTTNSHISCQNESFKFQLERGIRVLDTRLAYYAGYKGAEGVRYWHKHHLASGRTLHEMLQAIKAFLAENPDEYIIIDIHDLKPAHNKPVPYEDLAIYLEHELKDLGLPFSAASMTLEQLKKVHPGQTVIVAADYSLSRHTKLAWPKIDHVWIDQTLVTAAQLGAFIDRVMQRPPSKQLWSLSVTGYGLLGPTQLGGEIAQWFAAGGPYQMQSNIINVDWFEGSELVRNCIASNIDKARIKAR